MQKKSEGPLARPKVSHVLEETRQASRHALDPVNPGLRMEMAFSISLDAMRLHSAGLKAQGRSGTDISAQVAERPR
jgi:hypothetical protein